MDEPRISDERLARMIDERQIGGMELRPLEAEKLVLDLRDARAEVERLTRERDELLDILDEGANRGGVYDDDSNWWSRVMDALDAYRASQPQGGSE